METIELDPAGSSTNDQDIGTILREAVASGHSDVVIEYIKNKSFDLSLIIDAAEGENLLMFACRNGREEIVQAMTKLDDFATQCKNYNKDHKMPLIIASEMGHADVVQILLDYLINCREDTLIDSRDSGGFSALMWACYKGLTSTAELLIQKGKANVNTRAENNMTCLMWASGRGHEQICKLLVQNAASVNATDKFGGTAFFWACRHNRIEIAKYLLQHGANPDIAGPDGKTPLMLAAKSGNMELAAVILSTSSPNLNMTDGDGCTPLMMAAKERHFEIVSALIEAGASLSACDKKNDTALIYAVRAGRIEVVKKLCEGRVDINHQGQDSKTALYCAVEKMLPEIVELLLFFRADAEICASDKSTPLLKAVKLKTAAIVELLLNANARLTPTDKDGDTVLHIALRQRSRRIVQLLLKNPRNARLLYKPNKHNVTPYSIDEKQEAPILPQLFGNMNLNRAEQNQSLVGYELYSSSLAVMVSEPTLCTPLTVGLYARWGSGKSFVVSQLKDYLSQYVVEGVVLFCFTPLVIFLCLLIAALVGLVLTLSVSRDLWFVGLAGSLSVMLCLIMLLLGLWWFSRRRAAPHWVISLSQKLESFMRKLSIIKDVVFCNPRATQQYIQQLRFIVVNCPKFSGNVRPSGIIRAVLAEMYVQVEAAYGSLTSKLLLIFPPNDTSHRHFRMFCCIPLYIWALAWAVVTYVDCILIYAYFPPFATWREVEDYDDTTPSVFIVIFSTCSVIGFLVFFFGVVCRFAYLSIRPPYQQLLASETADSVLTEEALGRLVKHHTNLLSRCVLAIDAFAGTQTRFLVILDELDTYDQVNVVHMLDVVHRHFASESRAPFINILVLDPHIIIKHLEDHLASSNYEGVQMTGHDYLRSVVHLPIFLQAQPAITIRQKSPTAAISTHPTRNQESSVSAQGGSIKQRYLVRSKKQSDNTSIKSFASTTGRQHRNSAGFVDEVGMAISMQNVSNQVAVASSGGPANSSGLSELIGNMSAEYFSEVNPRTLTRVTNICAFMARLLHASNVQFNWYNLTAWVNLTEQWPYHLSWMLVYIENAAPSFELDLQQPMYTVYLQVKKLIPANDAMRFMDKSPLKLEAALNNTAPLLTLNDVFTFLRFSVNLDPYLRRLVREHANQLRSARPATTTATASSPIMPPPSGILSPVSKPVMDNQLQPPQRPQEAKQQRVPLQPVLRLEKAKKPLAQMSVEDVCDFMSKIPNLTQSNIDKYRAAFVEHNICGPVLVLCNLEELHAVIPMTFGDWQLFVVAVGMLRNVESENVSSSKNMATGPTYSTVLHVFSGHDDATRSSTSNNNPSELILSVPGSDVIDYVTPDSAADVKTPAHSVDGEAGDIYGEQVRLQNSDEAHPPIASTASASAIQNIESALLRRAVSTMLSEDEPSEDEDGGNASFYVGDGKGGQNVGRTRNSVDLGPADSVKSSSIDHVSTVPSSPAMSESNGLAEQGIYNKKSTSLKVIRSALSPVPSASFVQASKGRTESENVSDDSCSTDGRSHQQRKLEQRPLLASVD